MNIQLNINEFIDQIERLSSEKTKAIELSDSLRIKLAELEQKLALIETEKLKASIDSDNMLNELQTEFQFSKIG